MPPYYVTTQLPGSDKPEFLLMLPLSVAGKNQMAGWLAGLSDGENYGKMVAFRFPKGIFIDGPAQVESRISSDSRFSGDLSLWDQRGSRVIRGNLIVLPLADNQLIVIEPVYIEAEQTKIPMLARVVLGQLLPDDRKIEWASTLTDAERLLVGAVFAGFAIKNCSRLAPPLIAAVIHRGCAPRPDQVLPDLSRYLGATFLPASLLLRGGALDWPWRSVLPVRLASCARRIYCLQHPRRPAVRCALQDQAPPRPLRRRIDAARLQP